MSEPPANSAVPLCRNCVYFMPGRDDANLGRAVFEYAKCKKTATQKIDLVSGETLTTYDYCSTERQSQKADACSVGGRHFAINLSPNEHGTKPA